MGGGKGRRAEDTLLDCIVLRSEKAHFSVMLGWLLDAWRGFRHIFVDFCDTRGAFFSPSAWQTVDLYLLEDKTRPGGAMDLMRRNLRAQCRRNPVVGN